MRNFDLQKYFKRISFSDNPAPDLNTLKQLHLQHMLSVPFENLDIHIKRKITLNQEMLYKKIVENNRGGFCYEMNGLFYDVLKALGFKAKVVSARVYDSSEPSPEFDHMALIVTLDDGDWLADVGFGDSFLEPLKLEPETVQKQYGKSYKIEIIDKENFKVQNMDSKAEWNNMYRFSLIPRALNDFDEMCVYNQSSPQSHFTQKRFCSLARTNGRITLSGMKLIETKDGVRKETELEDEREFNARLKEIFGIVL
jgi:N-hydroxyarylamine O-acetyltransferase